MTKNGFRRVSGWWQDCQHACRMLRKSPGFTAMAISGIALGVGSMVAVFSLVNAILLQPLPFPRAHELVEIYEAYQHYKTEFGCGGVSAPTFLDWREQARSFAALAAFKADGFALKTPSGTTELDGVMVSPNYFEVLKQKPLIGRTFQAEDEREQSSGPVMISEELWRDVYKGSPSALGGEIMLNGKGHRIVGVLPAGFKFPTPRLQVWVPLVLTAYDLAHRDMNFFQVTGRLKANVSLDQAQREMEGIRERLLELYPKDQADLGVFIRSLHDVRVGDFGPSLVLVFGVVLCLLLITASNVANLTLSRTVRRRRELAIRFLLGAPRGRLTGQLLTESMVLAVVGGALGLLVASLAVELFRAYGAGSFPRAEEVCIDWWSLAAAGTVTFLVGLGSGLAPARFILRQDEVAVQRSLRDGGPSTASVQHSSLRTGLMVAQVACAFVLLMTATVFVRSFLALAKVDVGMANLSQLLSGKVTLPPGQYSNPEAVTALWDRVYQRLNALPQVDKAGAATVLPLDMAEWVDLFEVEGLGQGQGVKESHRPIVSVIGVGGDYFRTAGLALAAGRDFDSEDILGRPFVVVVNRTLAERYFGTTRQAIGHTLKLENGLKYRIVGVVADAKQTSLLKPTRPGLYFPYAQDTSDGGAPFARTVQWILRAKAGQDPLRLGDLLRQVIREADPGLAVSDVQRVDNRFAAALKERQLTTWVLAGFGAVALFLVLLGIYGVISFGVEQRTREFGVRIALGAQPKHVLGPVLRHCLQMVMAGILLGLVVFIVCAHLLRTSTEGLIPTDLPTLTGVIAFLVITSLIASYGPARRATLVDPMLVLRTE